MPGTAAALAPPPRLPTKLCLARAFCLAFQTYETSFGMVPGQEGHGGVTYCAVAALQLMDRGGEVKHPEELKHWLLRRQIGGFQGRVNKAEDTCYSFWVGASLQMLDGSHSFIDPEPLALFIETCKTKYGGYSKTPDTPPDILHSFYSLCGLSLAGVAPLQPINSRLGLTVRCSRWCEEVRSMLGATVKDECCGEGSGEGCGAGGGSASASAPARSSESVAS